VKASKSRKLFLATGAFLCLLILCLVGDLFQGKWALAKFKKELVKKGEQLSVLPFIKKIDPSQNAGSDFIRLVSSFTNSSVKMPLALPTLFFINDGHFVQPVSTLNSWTNKTAGDVHSWEEFEEALDSSRQSLEDLYSVLKRPSLHFGIILTNGFSDLQVSGLLQVTRGSQWLMMQTLVSLRRGNKETALKCLESLSKVVAQPDSESLLIVQLVKYAAAFSASYAVWEALESHAFSDIQLEQIQKHWMELNFMNEMLQAFEVERNMTIDHFALTRGSKKVLNEALSNQVVVAKMTDGEPLDDQGVLFRSVRIPLWRTGWSFQEELHSLKEWQKSLEDYRQVPFKGWADIHERTSETNPLTGIQKFKFLLSHGLALNHHPTTFSRAVRTQILKELVVTAIALERFRMKTGQYPNDLNAMIPNFLIELPKDWIDAQPLRYSSKDGEDYLLYSIGSDFKDDGGSGESTKAKGASGTSFWDRKDWIWPRPIRPD